MAVSSFFLSKLTPEERWELVERLYLRQHGQCFIGRHMIHSLLPSDDPEIVHVIPIADGGKDEESNFALVCASCNRGKSPSD